MNFGSLAKLFLIGCLVNLLLVAIDFVWLWALPYLGISYGRLRPALFGLSVLRAGIFLCWLIIIFGICLLRSCKTPGYTYWLLIIPNLLLLGMALYGFYLEPFHLTTTRLEADVPGLDHKMRIVQLSDMHVERMTQREKALPALVASQKPDMIVITGDLINESYVNNPDAIKALREVIQQLHAPLGIYIINGNVESPTWLYERLGDLDVHILDNSVVRIPEFGEHFAMIGLSFVNWVDDEEELGRLMTSVKPGDYTLLLYHKPDLAYAAKYEKIDLYLCGHTHGGQVRLPFYGALVTNARYGKEFEMGVYHLDQTTIFVSRGLGFTGGIAPRIRFLAPPEVAVIDLNPQK